MPYPKTIHVPGICFSGGKKLYPGGVGWTKSGQRVMVWQIFCPENFQSSTRLFLVINYFVAEGEGFEIQGKALGTCMNSRVQNLKL